MDRRIGDEHGAAAHQRHRDADRPMARAVVDGAAHVVERDGEIAGEAGHQGIGIAHRHHAGGEDIAVLIGQALAIAEQEAVALQPLIEKVGVVDIALGNARIEDLDIVVEFESRSRRASFGSSVSRPISMAVPRPALAKLLAARIMRSSSPSAKTTRFGLTRTWPKISATCRRSDRGGPKAARHSPRDRRYACARRPIPSRPWQPPPGCVEMRRGSNGTGIR